MINRHSPKGPTAMTLTATHFTHGTVEVARQEGTECHLCDSTTTCYDQVGMITSCPTCITCLTSLGWTLDEEVGA